MLRLTSIVTSLAVLIVSSQLATAEFLVFSDDFDGNDFDEKWTHSTESLAVVNGRVESTANGQFIRSIQSFSGDLRVEYDFGKEGTQNHVCWDNFVAFTGLNSLIAGVILFDHNGIDGAGLDINPANGVCLSDTNFASTPAASINSGHAVFTYQDSKTSFKFTNDDGVVLDAGTVDAGTFEQTHLYLNLAAFSDSVRWIDNVQVYSSVPEPSTLILFTMAGLVGAFIAWRKRKRT